MTLRIAAACAVVLGAILLLVYLDELGKAPWSSPAARHLRAMKDRVALPAAYEPLTAADMGRLPRGAPVAEYAVVERRAVAVEGYVQRMIRASDGDIHLDFAPERAGPGERLRPYVSAEVTPQWHRGSERWRYGSLAAGFRPVLGGTTRWADGPRRARISGWLLYDYPFEGATSHGPFPARIAQWEIHPVTRIELWDDPRGAYVEVPR